MGAARRGEQLTQQLLAFSRRQMLRPQTLNPNRLLLDFKPLAERAAGGAVELAFDLDPAIDPIRIDPAQFEAAVLNLVVNARDAMEGRDGPRPHRPVTSPEHPPLYLNRRRQGGAARSLRDGVGHGHRQRHPVRRAPARVRALLHHEGGLPRGTGWLEQVFGFTRSANGFARIDRRSRAGHDGQPVLPTLDRSSRREPGTGPVSAIPLRRAGAGETVLLVEDDEPVLAMAVESLEELPVRVVVARNAAEALEHLRGVERIDIPVLGPW